MPNKRLINKIILIGVATMAGFILLLFFSGKRPNRDFYLPEQFEGWVKIKHGLPGAAELEASDGVLQIYIPDTGYLETATFMKQGWGRDRYFRLTPEGPIPIPNYEKREGETRMYIFGQGHYAINYAPLLHQLPEGADTTFWDGTRLKKEEGRVSYTPGKKVLEYFYVSKQPRPIDFRPPPNPDAEMLKSMEDYELVPE